MTAKVPVARRAWIRAALPMIKQELRRLRAPAQQRDELQSVAHEALVRAALRYDAQRKVPFPAYARQRIRWAMIDYLRAEHPAHRRAQRARQNAKRLASLRELSPSALAPGEQDPVALARERARLLEMEQWMHRLSHEAFPSQEDPPPRQDPRALLAHLLRAISPKDRNFLLALYRDELSLQQYARRQGISPSTASRHHCRLLQKLRRTAQTLRMPDGSDLADAAQAPSLPRGSRSGQ